MIPYSSYSKHPEGDVVALTIVSIALSLEGGKCFSTILRKWVLKNFFFWRGGACRKGWSYFVGGFKVFRGNNYELYFTADI